VVGDVLDFGNETCKVKEISLRATMVSTSEGADILIPNNSLLSERLKNWTISNKQRFLEIKVQTVLGSDPTVVMQLISKILDGQEELIRERCKIYLAEINDEGFVFSIKILIDDLSNGSKLRSELLLKIQEAFTKNGIRFPQSSNLSN
jgi:small-conductance mechanosensitive channel